jgi:hypothetical protein
MDPRRPGDDAIDTAEQLIGREQYWDAIQLLEAITYTTNRKQKERAIVLLAKAYIKNPNRLTRPAELLWAVLRENPQHVEAQRLLFAAEDAIRRTEVRRVRNLDPESGGHAVPILRRDWSTGRQLPLST